MTKIFRADVKKFDFLFFSCSPRLGYEAPSGTLGVGSLAIAVQGRGGGGVCEAAIAYLRWVGFTNSNLTERENTPPVGRHQLLLLSIGAWGRRRPSGPNFYAPSPGKGCVGSNFLFTEVHEGSGTPSTRLGVGPNSAAAFTL